MNRNTDNAQNLYITLSGIIRDMTRKDWMIEAIVGKNDFSYKYENILLDVTSSYGSWVCSLHIGDSLGSWGQSKHGFRTKKEAFIGLMESVQCYVAHLSCIGNEI